MDESPMLFMDGAMLGLAVSGAAVGGWFGSLVLIVLAAGLMWVVMTASELREVDRAAAYEMDRDRWDGGGKK